jgi:hypothetical protein
MPTRLAVSEQFLPSQSGTAEDKASEEIDRYCNRSGGHWDVFPRGERRRLQETMFKSKLLVRRAQAAEARKAGKPYLETVSGQLPAHHPVYHRSLRGHTTTDTQSNENAR